VPGVAVNFNIIHAVHLNCWTHPGGTFANAVFFWFWTHAMQNFKSAITNWKCI